MSKLLSQEEIDALMHVRQKLEESDTSDLASLESIAVEPPQRISAYNFKRPKLFAQDQLRVLNHIHEAFARSLSVYLSAQLRTIVDMRLLAIDQVLYSEYVMSSAPPTALYVIRVNELGHEALIEMDPCLGIFIVEKLFGGSGAFLKRPREISQIEQRILTKVMQRTLTELSKAWHQVYPMTMDISGFETNAEFVQIIPGVEPTLVSTFEVFIYEKRSLVSICYPYLLLEQILGRLEFKRWISNVATEIRPEARQRYETSLRAVNIELRAELGRARVPIKELMGLQVGDVVVLDKSTTEPVEVFAGSELKFRAATGKAGKYRALRILESVTPDIPEDCDHAT